MTSQIPVKVSLEALGKNLGEHQLFILPGFAVNDSSIFLKIGTSEIEKISEDFNNGEGVLTQTTQAQCFITSSKARPGWPDLWIQIHPVTSVDDKEVLNFYNILGRPKSKGIFTLDTDKYKEGVRDDVQLAQIDYKLLTHPDDMEALLEGNVIEIFISRVAILKIILGVKFIFKIIETEAFKSINLTYIVGPDPACEAFTFLTDDYWKCKFQQDVRSCTHMIGTCSMGPDSDNSSTSVVDTQFRF